MGAFHPIHWLILAIVVLMLVGGYGAFRAPNAQSGFFKGMTAASALALSGVLFLALALLVGVYGEQSTLGADPIELTAGLAGAGAALMIAAAGRWFSKRRG